MGDKFTVTVEGLPAGQQVDLQWTAVEGSYVTEVSADNVQYIERVYKQKRAPLGRGTTGTDGRLSVAVTAPEDHGETHDIFAVVSGNDVAKGGFRIVRSVAVSTTEGPIGTLIAIIVKGMSSSYYQSTMAVRWDNAYTGFISTVTTKGTGVAQIRAAGPPGEHTLQVYPASHALPYLNSHQGPNWDIFGHLPDKFIIKVTGDKGAPPAATEWPEAASVAKLGASSPRTTVEGTAPAIPLVVEPGSGPILSEATLRADGLPANTPVDLLWVTARGNRSRASGWSLDDVPVGKAATGSDGSLRAKLQVPDDLGGWHTIKVVAGGKILTSVPYYVERSLVEVTPKRVKAGEQFKVQMKGIGWTELDNGIAATYDNTFVGYACGFNSNGDITLYLTATGGPGTHLIDVYPMIYEGHPNKQVFNFAVPQLTALQDNPSLAIGYRLPIFRVAIEVTE
ncbi:MAG: hypothetical protein HY331_13020 [Chloroflexi bacterium]|nr:hypothetical protein [Chloroflexota bacterium]